MPAGRRCDFCFLTSGEIDNRIVIAYTSSRNIKAGHLFN